jgi:Divergent InlB B-repeat domain/Bacterial Ig-like domain (group 2)
MNRNWLVAMVSAAALFLPSCGHDQQLVSISVQPTVETFGASNIPVSADAGLSVQLRALGTYIHPPVTKDITGQVTWASGTPGIATVNSTGLVTATGVDCGGTIVSATLTTNNSGTVSSSGAIVTGSMTANVVCFTGSSGGSGPILTVALPGAGSGTVSSSPGGINCPTACSASFTSGTPVTLTATPNTGSTFAGWSSNCQPAGQVCTVSALTSDLTVTATFN